MPTPQYAQYGNYFDSGALARGFQTGIALRQANERTQALQLQRQQDAEARNALQQGATSADLLNRGLISQAEQVQQFETNRAALQDRAMGTLGRIAQQALAVPPEQRRQFLTSTFSQFGGLLRALGTDQATIQQHIANDDDTTLENTLRALAPIEQPIKLAPGESLVTRQPGGGFKSQITQPGKVTFEDAGGTKEPRDAVTGQPRPDVPSIKKTPPPAQQFTTDSVEQTAQLIANGQIPALSGFAMRSPWGQQVMARVGQINPDYRAGTNVSQTATMRAFASGTEGRTTRSLNVAISHLDTLSGLADALNNGDIQRINQISNLWKTETGNPAPTSFTSARDIVANEVVKAVTASGGSLADRQEAQAQIKAAASPAQLKGVIQTWQQLLGGQLEGLRQQYEQGTNLKDFDKFLSPRTKQVLEPTQPAAGNGPVRVNTPQEAMALPPGTQFVTPDGRVKVRP
jgi:hypothetical protein